MPSPLIHLAVAAAAARLAPPPDAPRPRLRLFAVAAVASLLPDVDAAAGLLASVSPETLSLVHNQGTHSLLFCALATPLLSLLARPFLRPLRYRTVLALVAALLASHLLLDFFTWGRGLMLLWPFSDARFASPVPLFYGVRYALGLRTPAHLVTLATELLTLLLLALPLLLFRRRPNVHSSAFPMANPKAKDNPPPPPCRPPPTTT